MLVNEPAAQVESELVSDRGTVMVVHRDGSLDGVPLRSGEPAGPLDSRPEAIDDLWPPDVTAVMRRSIKRVLKAREQCSHHLEDSTDGQSYEFLYVPQGPDRVLLIVRNRSSQSLLLSPLKQLAYTDPVTGLPNREFLLAELRRAVDLQRLKRGRAAVICLHVDALDERAFVAASTQLDDALKALAERLELHTRCANAVETGVSERRTIVARLDFRQLGVVLPSIECGEDAESVARRLIGLLREPVNRPGRPVSLSVCGGVALFPQDGTDAGALMHSAEAAMDEARNDGDGSLKLQSGTVRLRSLQRQDLESELRDALERGRYALRFLPVVDSARGMPVTVEALLRWPRTTFENGSAQKLIRLAERMGLMTDIGAWVLGRACEQLGSWRRDGHGRIRVAVNLSAQEASSPGAAARIADIVEASGLCPEDLDLELGEHFLQRDAANGYGVCRALAATGSAS